jgi:hypothetical protein
LLGSTMASNRLRDGDGVDPATLRSHLNTFERSLEGKGLSKPQMNARIEEERARFLSSQPAWASKPSPPTSALPLASPSITSAYDPAPDYARKRSRADDPLIVDRPDSKRSRSGFDDPVSASLSAATPDWRPYAGSADATYAQRGSKTPLGTPLDICASPGMTPVSGEEGSAGSAFMTSQLSDRLRHLSNTLETVTGRSLMSRLTSSSNGMVGSLSIFTNPKAHRGVCLSTGKWRSSPGDALEPCTQVWAEATVGQKILEPSSATALLASEVKAEGQSQPGFGTPSHLMWKLPVPPQFAPTGPQVIVDDAHGMATHVPVFPTKTLSWWGINLPTPVPPKQPIYTPPPAPSAPAHNPSYNSAQRPGWTDTRDQRDRPSSGSDRRTSSTSSYNRHPHDRR